MSEGVVVSHVGEGWAGFDGRKECKEREEKIRLNKVII